MAKAFVNVRILAGDRFLAGHAVLVEGGRISGVVEATDARIRGADVHDLQGASLVPGFIDCQVNGGGGALFNDAPNIDTIRRIGAAHARFGTTGFLPTLISDDVDVMRAAIAAVDAAITAGVPGVIGIHLEGPYLAPERRGIHNAAKFHIPQSGDIALVSSLRHGRTLITLAPERVDAEAIGALVAHGVIVAGGHTAADYATTRRVLDAGMRGFTHLFNAMTPMQSREPGVVGAALEDAASWCGLIVDGFHLHPAVLRVALAAKAQGKLFLVTDAMPPVGSAEDTFELNGETITCRDGRCVNAKGTLAGSSLDMAAAVRNTIEQTGIAPQDALRMASTYPAAFLGLQSTHGQIATGYAADFVVLDDALGVRETWIGGERIFAA
ncbi:MAG TPA: N-acetylglucosamine-6-phosphate deacetylase [Rhodanobacteraceae bacterium]|nr:N-acetylglucosamine-6-phosphate deacetylase [Rhodanobacteraceae bacterium]